MNGVTCLEVGGLVNVLSSCLCLHSLSMRVVFSHTVGRETSMVRAWDLHWPTHCTEAPFHNNI